MKKLYMPTMEQLYTMQDMGANVYKYLMIKAVESIILDGKNYTTKGILKNAYQYVQEDPYLSYMISLMYPNEVEYSNRARNNKDLATRLIMQEIEDRTIYNLDRLGSFSDSTLKSPIIIDGALMVLDNELENNPKYRFEYKQNMLLDSIFSTELAKTIEINSFDPTDILSKIEPGYALALSDEFFKGTSREEILKTAIDEYAERYGFIRPNVLDYNLREIDPTTKLESKEVKKLIRCINHNTDRY